MQESPKASVTNVLKLLMTKVKYCVMETDTGRSARAVMVTEVSRVCELRQLVLVLEEQSTSK